MGVDGYRDAPEEPRHSFQEAGWAPGSTWAGFEEKTLLSSTGLKHRTVQPVASNYTDYALRPRCSNNFAGKAVSLIQEKKKNS